MAHCPFSEGSRTSVIAPRRAAGTSGFPVRDLYGPQRAAAAASTVALSRSILNALVSPA